MKAEIITIGDELLIGQTIDTNSSWIGAELSRAGFDIIRKSSIQDNRISILEALESASGRVDVVLITGGLGPTSDDITKQTLCEFFHTKLVVNQNVLAMINEMAKRRNMQMNENNRKQAEVPESCKVLTNATGTAPGMWFEKGKTIFVSMPGVPNEMKYIMNEHVLPELKKLFTSQVVIHRNIMTYGLPEAMLAETLSSFEADLPPEIKLAYLPSFGVIKLRLTGKGKNREHIAKLIDAQVIRLYSEIPEFIYGENEETLEMTAGKLLTKKGITMCTAESCTGGNIARLITSIPGSSAYFTGSIIAYDNSVKSLLLDVDKEAIMKEGAVSEKIVRLMAEGARKLLKTDFALATSGIAGPDGGTPEKPVGTVWIAVASQKRSVAEKHVFSIDRTININRFSLAALNLLVKEIKALCEFQEGLP
ncbi:MAG: competence/damage-inducible protein A [Bacteroidales bacterium]|jgi:nicotinamide-nucleotide amidase